MHTYVYIQQNSNTAGVLGFKKKFKKIHSSVSLTQAHPHSPAAHKECTLPSSAWVHDCHLGASQSVHPRGGASMGPRLTPRPAPFSFHICQAREALPLIKMEYIS